MAAASNEAFALFLSANFSLDKNSSSFNDIWRDDTDRLAPLWMRIFALIIAIIVVFAGGVGNTTVLLSFVMNRQLRRSQHVNTFCLSTLDLISTMYFCTHSIIRFYTGEWYWSQAYCQIYLLVCGVSFYGARGIIIVLSYERYLIVRGGGAIREGQGPLTTRKRWIRAVSVGLILPLTIIGPPTYIDKFTGVSVSRPGECIAEINQLPIIYLLFTMATFLTSIGILLVNYIAVYRFTRRRVGATAGQQQPGGGSKPQKSEATGAGVSKTVVVVPARNFLPNETLPSFGGRAFVSTYHRPPKKSIPAQPYVTKHSHIQLQQQRAVRVINAIFLCIFVSGIPLISVIIIGALRQVGLVHITWHWQTHLIDLANFIAFINNAMNPFIYAAMMPDIRRAMVNVWARPFDWILGQFSVQQQIRLHFSQVDVTKTGKQIESQHQEQTEPQHLPQIVIT